MVLPAPFGPRNPTISPGATVERHPVDRDDFTGMAAYEATNCSHAPASRSGTMYVFRRLGHRYHIAESFKVSPRPRCDGPDGTLCGTTT